jgi:hypothetical protein
MNASFDDIPTIESLGRLGRRAEAESAVEDAYSGQRAPSAAGAISSLGVALGLQAVTLLRDRVFPQPEQITALNAAGAGASYNTYFDCGGVDYPVAPGEACWGFEAHHMDPFYCATCEEQAADPANNPSWNWHFTGARGSITYMDREPDVCPGPSGARDAWKWEVGPTGECAQSAVYRCHDGYKHYPNDPSWTATICQGLVSCDNKLTLCD